MTGLEPVSLIYLMIVTFLAAIARGYSGFGFSALLVLAASWVLPPARIVPIILLLEIIASLQLLPSIWQHIQWSRLRRLLLGSAVSIPVGIYGLASIDGDLMQLLISLLVFIACLLIWRGYSFSRHDGPALDFGLGLISGAMTGVAAIGGLAVVAVFLSVQLKAVVIRATLVALFFATDIYASLLGVSLGLVDRQLLISTVFMLPPLLLGIMLGSRWFNHSTAQRFRQYTLMILMLLCVASLLRF